MHALTLEIMRILFICRRTKNSRICSQLPASFHPSSLIAVCLSFASYAHYHHFVPNIFNRIFKHLSLCTTLAGLELIVIFVPLSWLSATVDAAFCLILGTEKVHQVHRILSQLLDDDGLPHPLIKMLINRLRAFPLACSSYARSSIFLL